MRLTIGPFFAELEKLGFHEKLASFRTLALGARKNPIAAFAEVMKDPKLRAEALQRAQSINLSAYPSLTGVSRTIPQTMPTGRLKMKAAELGILNALRNARKNPGFNADISAALDEALAVPLR